MGIFDIFKKKKTYTEILYPNPTTETHWFERVNIFQNDNREGGTIIVGDSITEGLLSVYPETDKFRNQGIAGDTSVGVTRRLTQVLKQKPDCVIFAIGTNDIGSQMVPGHKTGHVVEGYSDMNAILNSIIFNITSMSQILIASNNNIKICISSVLPINNVFDFTTTITSDMDDTLQIDITSVGPLLKTRNNSDVINLNASLVVLAKTYPNNIKFLDVYSQVLDENGLLKHELSLDGLHLNSEGYKVWIPILEKELV